MGVYCRYSFPVKGDYVVDMFQLNSIVVGEFIDSYGVMYKKTGTGDFADYFGNKFERTDLLPAVAPNSDTIIEIDVDMYIMDAIYEAIIESIRTLGFNCDETSEPDFITDLKRLKDALWKGFGYKMYFSVD